MENATNLKIEQIKLPKVNSHNPHRYKINICDEMPYASYLTKIVPKDIYLLQKTILHTRPNSINYEDCWGYIIQATRYGGFKWYDYQNGSLIFFGKKSENDHTLTIPSFFAEPAYLAYIVTIIQNALKSPRVILKNIDSDNMIDYASYGFRTYKENESWCEEARFDDQTYPQLVVDLEKVAEKKGNVYKNLRTVLNKKPNIAIRKYHETDKNDVLDIFALKDRASEKKIEKSKGTYYNSHLMYPTSDLDKFVIIDNETKNIVGFTATSDISTLNTTLVASLFKPGFKIASIWGIYQTLMIKYHQGFKKINLGGCESEGSYNFMRRTFQPIEELKKTHLVYNSCNDILKTSKSRPTYTIYGSGNIFQIKSNNFFELE